MFYSLFRNLTLYIFWKKFQKQIKVILVSFGLILFISWIYQDVFTLVKIVDKESLLWVVFAKWLFIGLIVLINIIWFKRIKIDEAELKSSIEKEKEPNYPKASLDVLEKKTILSRTDVILNKYSEK